MVRGSQQRGRVLQVSTLADCCPAPLHLANACCLLRTAPARARCCARDAMRELFSLSFATKPRGAQEFQHEVPSLPRVL